MTIRGPTFSKKKQKKLLGSGDDLSLQTSLDGRLDSGGAATLEISCRSWTTSERTGGCRFVVQFFLDESGLNILRKTFFFESGGWRKEIRSRLPVISWAFWVVQNGCT